MPTLGISDKAISSCVVMLSINGDAANLVKTSLLLITGVGSGSELDSDSDSDSDSVSEEIMEDSLPLEFSLLWLSLSIV